jgi:hypothetical protein
LRRENREQNEIASFGICGDQRPAEDCDQGLAELMLTGRPRADRLLSEPRGVFVHCRVGHKEDRRNAGCDQWRAQNHGFAPALFLTEILQIEASIRLRLPPLRAFFKPEPNREIAASAGGRNRASGHRHSIDPQGSP